ncbi:hypothetical protein [Streptomyces parvulus]|uniref:hypothetical protein n=1 Tax=Streptomyces parvulus TaxID=146923 RepID=UPI0033AA9E9D
MMPTTPHPRRGVTACTRCGAPIRWASGPQPGQRTPLNALPSPVGGLAAHTTGLGGLVVRELTPDRPEPEHIEWKAVAHFSSCTGGAGSRPSPPAVPMRRPAPRRASTQPPLWGQGRWGR